MIIIYECGEWMSEHPTWSSALVHLTAAFKEQDFYRVIVHPLGDKIYVLLED